MRADMWLLIALFAWIGLCIIVNAVMQRGRLIEDLRLRAWEERKLRKDAEAENVTLRNRIEAKERFVVLIRDQKISELEEEVKRLKTKNRAQKSAMENMWSGREADDVCTEN